MTPLNIAGQDAYATRHCMITSENASGGTEALKLNQPNATIDWEKNLRNRLKLALRASPNVEADAMAEVVVFTTDTAANDLLQEDCPDALIDLPVAPVVPVAPSAPVVPILRYKLLTDDDLSKLPPVQWRIKDVLPSHGTAVVFGPSGSGKSFLVLDMLQSLAFGHEWFGRRVKPCSVTYIALEGEAGLAGRVEAYRVQHGSSSPNIRYMVQPFRLLDADDINELVQAIQAAGTGDVVVLDTLSRATPGSDENDSKAMGQIVASAKMLQDLIGGLVLLIHHTGKDASRGMRGHSSLHAALDCAIEVKRTGDNREWVLAKSKDGEDGASHSFKLEVVSMGNDSDGDAITSCVIVPNQSAQTVGKKMPKLACNQTIALKALEVPLCKSVDIDKDGVPPGRPCLCFDDAIAIVAPLMPGLAKHQKQRAKEAITGLVGKGVLSENGKWLNHNQYPQH
jgi:putative DNA primase/helicase